MDSHLVLNQGTDCNVLKQLPAKLHDRLLPFQEQGIQFAVQKNGRCLIADEMGLGKTLQAISVAYCYKEEWPLLIIVPSSLKFCWVEELEKWLPDVLPHEINLVQNGSDVSGMAMCPITIVTYGLLKHPSSKVVREALTARRFQVVICDESHYLKNINTLSCKTVIPLLKAANRRILLSGTPALAKPVELYPQIDAICPGNFGSFWQYTEKYCDAHVVHFGKFRKRQVDGASNLEDLQQKLSKLMIRREKSDVLTELPPKQRQRILFELKNSPLKKEICDMFTELKQRIRKGDGNIQKVLNTQSMNLCEEAGGGRSDNESSVGIFSLISRLYKMSGEAKIGPVREYIEMLCKNEELKFLVFVYHHDMMDGIQQTLWDQKVKFVRIDGSTRSSDRQAFVNQFQADPDTRVAILSILAAGVGLTFTAAKLVVFAELYWTPGVMVQCEDRAHRIGQTCSLPVHYLVARETMDEWVWSAVCRKTLVTSTVLTGKTKKLDHEEGDSYQIQLLSNADMWEQKESDQNIDSSQLVLSQRQEHKPVESCSPQSFLPVYTMSYPAPSFLLSLTDQSSILEFFPSPRNANITQPRKRKHQMVECTPCHLFSNSEDNTKLKKDRQDVNNKSKSTFYDKISEVVIISDEENEFKPSKKSKKIYKEKNRKQMLTKTKRHKQAGETDRCDTVLVTSNEEFPNVNVMVSEEMSDCMESSHTTLESYMSKNSGSLTQGMVIHESSDIHIEEINEGKSFDKEVEDECSEQRLCYRTGRQSETFSKLTDIKYPVSKTIPNTEHSLSIPANGGHLYDSKASQELNSDGVQLDEKSTIGCWSCNECTFFNHPELPLCEVCDTPKKKSSRKQSSTHAEEVCPTSPSHPSSSSRINHPSGDSNIFNVFRESKYSNILKVSSETKHYNLSKVTSDTKQYPNCTNQSPEFTDLRSKYFSDTNKEKLSYNSVSLMMESENLPECQLPLQQKIKFPSSGTGADGERHRGSADLFCNDTDNQEHSSCLEVFSTAGQPRMICDFGSELVNLGNEHLCLASSIRNVAKSAINTLPPGLSTSCASTLSTSSIKDLPESKSVGLSDSDLGMLSTSHTPCTSTETQHLALVDPDRGQQLDSGSHTSLKMLPFLKYSCSAHTGRIYAYDENDQFLHASFQPVDVEMGNINDLPEVLQLPHHLGFVQKFVKQWSSLTDTKKRLIAKRCQIFVDPRSAYEEVKTVFGCKQRHLTKQDTLVKALKNKDKLQGSIQMISKRQKAPAQFETDCMSTTYQAGLAQVVTEDGVPLCLQCQRPFTCSLLSAKTVSNPENAWQLRLCSFACMDKYWTLSKASYCRDQVYDIEHGVCQMCHYDAHKLYTQIKIIKDKKTRVGLIKNSPYKSLTTKQLEKMIQLPQAGQFWHVDHITPVWQGGGMCDLDNLRTLCTPCHLKVTCRQAGQRATMRKLSGAAGQADITTFFQRI